MDASLNRQISGMAGESALPRQNGELVFAAPWEARAFGLAVALQEGGAYEWREFSAALAAEISKAEQASKSSSYYERWLLGLENLLIANSVVTPAEVNDRMAYHAAHLDHAGHDHT